MALEDASHTVIADLLQSRTGQTLSESRRWRISTALSGLFREFGIENVDQLACMLERPGEHRLATRVVEALLNNETYFFRDHAYFATLANTVLPELAKRRSATKKLSIWSAGCSTGQEVLSLAMNFCEQPARWADWTIEILGTDISSKAIAQAKSGCFSQFEIQRGISVAQMLNFFSENSGGMAGQRPRPVADPVRATKYPRCRPAARPIRSRPVPKLPAVFRSRNAPCRLRSAGRRHCERRIFDAGSRRDRGRPDRPVRTVLLRLRDLRAEGRKPRRRHAGHGARATRRQRLTAGRRTLTQQGKFQVYR